MYVMVTGCRGFLGHHLVPYLLQRGHQVLGLDAETYAAIHPAQSHRRFRYQLGDICDLTNLPAVDAIINCAAETHVDNSLLDASRFLHSNIIGVHRLLELVRGKRQYEMPLFLQVSTDEVLGESPGRERFDESAPPRPRNPYAASKLAAEALVTCWGISYHCPTRILRPSNFYGLGQYPEKLIPKAIRLASQDRPIPIHGDGSASRHWLDIRDACTAVETVLLHGTNGEIYHAGGNTEAMIGAVAGFIVSRIGSGGIEYIPARQGLDQRYCLNDDKLRALGWTPKGDFWADLAYQVEVEKGLLTW